MVELKDYLGAHGFRTFIVSGGSADFMRTWSEDAYGIPPCQVIGSYGKLKYDVVNGNHEKKTLVFFLLIIKKVIQYYLSFYWQCAGFLCGQ